MSYLQVSLHERRPGLHQAVTDSRLAGGGGLVERGLAPERHNGTVSDTRPRREEGSDGRG